MQLPLQDVEGSLTESDTRLMHMQTYLNELADAFLNHDYTSDHSLQILSIFDDINHSLSDKIKMLILETSLLHALLRNKSLENDIAAFKNDLYHTRRGLNDVNTAVVALHREMEQLKAHGISNTSNVSTNNISASVAAPPANNLMRQTQTDPSTVTKTAKNNVFTQHPTSPSGLFFPNNNPHSLTHVTHPATPTVVSGKSQDMNNTNTSSSNMIVEFAEIEPSVLVSVTENILLEKGPLPVGEVGKMLQEVTCNLQLSQLIKEKHNGLKKFLEKFPDKFIMSTDHPFNPHVYLRRCFSADEQRKIENGCTSFLDEFKKNKVSGVMVTI